MLSSDSDDDPDYIPSEGDSSPSEDASEDESEEEEPKKKSPASKAQHDATIVLSSDSDDDESDNEEADLAKIFENMAIGHPKCLKRKASSSDSPSPESLGNTTTGNSKNSKQPKKQ